MKPKRKFKPEVDKIHILYKFITATKWLIFKYTELNKHFIKCKSYSDQILHLHLNIFGFLLLTIFYFPSCKWLIVLFNNECWYSSIYSKQP